MTENLAIVEQTMAKGTASMEGLSGETQVEPVTSQVDLVPIVTKRKRKRSQFMAKVRINKLLKKCDEVLEGIADDLDEARELVEPLGMTVDSSILDTKFSTCADPVVNSVLRTTAGHSNTDHVVRVTGDPRADWLNEWKRSYQRRIRSMQPESRGEARWDKLKLPGERRRRIVREKDAPQAPLEPPPSGYVIFISQMTCKRRHDNPNEPHNQTKVVQEISKIWRNTMSEQDREYYNTFARKAREEYQVQLQEFRATGKFQPSERFEKMEDGNGPWVKKRWHEKNRLEREIAAYETVVFPARPADMDEAYFKRRDESNKRRKEKLKAQAREERAKRERAKQNNTAAKNNTNENSNNKTTQNVLQKEQEDKLFGAATDAQTAGGDEASETNDSHAE